MPGSLWILLKNDISVDTVLRDNDIYFEQDNVDAAAIGLYIVP